MSALAGPRGASAPVADPFGPPGRADGVAMAENTQSSPRGEWLESLLVFVIFGAAYGVLGYWLVVDQRVFTFDSLQRLANAYGTWHGSPPKLAAIGFSLPPLQTIVLLPFTIITSMATSLVALPVCSAIFGGLTMMGFNRLLRRCDMSVVFRYPALVLTALIPTIAFYSAGGGEEMISLFLLTAGISSLIAWFRTVDTRFLISSGMALGFAVLADYTNLVWLLLAGAMVATVLSRHGADDAEVEGSIITYIAPALYALALWCLINWLIVSSPFGWLNDAGASTVNVAASHLVTHGASLLQALGDSLRLALNAAPLSLVIAPALIVTAVVQRNELAGWLAAFTILAIFRPGAEAIVHANIADVQMSLSPPQILMALAGAGWIYRSFPDARALIGGGLLIGLIASIVVVWHGTATYPYQNMEQAFHDAIAHTGNKPTESRGGRAVGVEQERKMADYIRAHVHSRRSILTDNSQTYGVILLAADPHVFRTRLENGGSGTWLDQVRTPPRSVRYFLIAYTDPNDAIHSAYLKAVNGGLMGITVVFKDARYALLSVAPGTTERNSTPAGHNAAQPGGLINLGAS